MRLLTFFDEQGDLRPGYLYDGKVIDIQQALALYQTEPINQKNANPITFSSVKSVLFLSSEGNEVLEKAVFSVIEMLESKTLSPDFKNLASSLENISLAPPIPNPGKIICVGMNYPAEVDTIKPDYPVVFLKPASGLTADQTAIRLPQICKDTHYEAELAFYIGKTCHNVPRSEAQEYIAGYTIANDIGDRTLERRTSQWVSGKMFETFTPNGPYFVSADEVPDPHALPISTWLNDELVQEAVTGEMLFNIDEILAYISTLTTLYPGDLILTGSPKLFQGELHPQPPLQTGDTIKVTIGSLGTLTNRVEQGD
jgi:acylpyruvate hydrolase